MHQIKVLLKTNTPIKKVAKLLDTDKSTLYREIARNKKMRTYSASYAQSVNSDLATLVSLPIRQHIIKSSNFDLYDSDFIKLVQNEINRRPRKKLNFQTPAKIFVSALY